MEDYADCELDCAGRMADCDGMKPDCGGTAKGCDDAGDFGAYPGYDYDDLGFAVDRIPAGVDNTGHGTVVQGLRRPG